MYSSFMRSKGARSVRTAMVLMAPAASLLAVALAGAGLRVDRGDGVETGVRGVREPPRVAVRAPALVRGTGYRGDRMMMGTDCSGARRRERRGLSRSGLRLGIVRG
jgi:hypothetical protein